jgi:hypothetical protein
MRSFESIRGRTCVSRSASKYVAGAYDTFSAWFVSVNGGEASVSGADGLVGVEEVSLSLAPSVFVSNNLVPKENVG